MTPGTKTTFYDLKSWFSNRVLLPVEQWLWVLKIQAKYWGNSEQKLSDQLQGMNLIEDKMCFKIKEWQTMTEALFDIKLLMVICFTCFVWVLPRNTATRSRRPLMPTTIKSAKFGRPKRYKTNDLKEVWKKALLSFFQTALAKCRKVLPIYLSFLWWI